jgi:hypothetical protein
MKRAEILESISPGNSEMAQLMRESAWSTSEAGAPDNWPESRRLTQIYHDRYADLNRGQTPAIAVGHSANSRKNRVRQPLVIALPQGHSDYSTIRPSA